MKNNLFRFLVFAFVLTLAVSCNKNKKPDEGDVGDTGGSGTPNITSDAMSFNPQGSDTGQIQGLHTIHFAYDDSSLTEPSKVQLKENVDWIKKNPNLDIQVEGHCDERGSTEYNLALGDRRAKSVKAYLVTMGIPAKRIRTVSYGKEKKIDNGDTEEAHAKNRRANFVPLPK